MKFAGLLGRITGADKKKQYPAQQGSFFGRIGDYFIIQPYGYHCDLPNDTLLVQLGLKSAISANEKRPTDLAVGEVAVFNPITNSRIVFRNNGDIDLISSGTVNVEAPDVNITGNVTVTGDMSVTGDTTFTGSVSANDKSIDETHKHDGSPTAATGPKSDTGAVL